RQHLPRRPAYPVRLDTQSLERLQYAVHIRVDRHCGFGGVEELAVAQYNLPARVLQTPHALPLGIGQFVRARVDEHYFPHYSDRTRTPGRSRTSDATTPHAAPVPSAASFGFDWPLATSHL